MSFPEMSKISSSFSRLLVGLLMLVVQRGRAGDFSLDSAGARFGFGVQRDDLEFHQAEAFVNWELPWGWDLGRTFWMQTRFDVSGGWLGDAHRSVAIGTAGGSLVFSHGQSPVSLEGGFSPTVISRHEFTNLNLGSLYQFTSHVGLNLDIRSGIRLSYRFQHMSNGGFTRPNPGLNLHVFGVSYLF